MLHAETTCFCLELEKLMVPRSRHQAILLALTTTNHNACAHDTNTSRLRTWQQAKSSARIAASQNACDHDTKPSRLRAWQQAKTKQTRLCDWQYAKSSVFAAASQVVFAHGSILGAAQLKEFRRSPNRRMQAQPQQRTKRIQAQPNKRI